MKSMMGAKLGDGGGSGGEEEFPGAGMVRCADSSRLPWTPAYMHAKLARPHKQPLQAALIHSAGSQPLCRRVMAFHKLCCVRCSWVPQPMRVCSLLIGAGLLHADQEGVRVPPQGQGKPLLPLHNGRCVACMCVQAAPGLCVRNSAVCQQERKCCATVGSGA